MTLFYSFGCMTDNKPKWLSPSRPNPGCWLLVLFILLRGSPGSGQALLQSYVEEALRENAILRQMEIPIAKSRLAEEEARRRALPSAEFGFSYTLAAGGRSIDLPIGDLLNPVYSSLNRLTQSNQFPQVENVTNQFLPNDFYDMRVRFTAPLWNKDLKLQREVRGKEILLQENEMARYRRELVLAVQTAYFQLGAAISARQILWDARAVVDRSVVTVKALVREGKALPAQVLKAENEREIMESRIADASGNVYQAERYLQFLLHRKPQDSVSFEKPDAKDYALDLNRSYAVWAENPVFRKLDIALSIQSILEKRNRQFFFPQVSLFTDMGSQEFRWQFNGNSIYLLGGAQLTIPLWTHRLHRIRGEQIRLEMQALQMNRQFSADQEALGYDLARSRVLTAKEALRAAEKQVSTAEAYMRLSENGFREGVMTLLEWTDARQQYTQALLQENIRFYQYILTVCEIKKIRP